jgi:hypothetical protein
MIEEGESASHRLALVWVNRERAEFVKAGAMPGGPVASKFLTIDRRLKKEKLRAAIEVDENFEYSSTLALAMNVSTIKLLRHTCVSQLILVGPQ